MAGPFQPTAPKRRKREREPQRDSEPPLRYQHVHSSLPQGEKRPFARPSARQRELTSDTLIQPIQPVEAGQGMLPNPITSAVLGGMESLPGSSYPSNTYPQSTQGFQNGHGNGTRRVSQTPVSAPPPPHHSYAPQQQHVPNTQLQHQQLGQQQAREQVQQTPEPMPWFVLNHKGDSTFRPGFDIEGFRLFNLLAFLYKHRRNSFQEFSKRCWDVYQAEFSRQQKRLREAENTGRPVAPGTPGRPSTPAPTFQASGHSDRVHAVAANPFARPAANGVTSRPSQPPPVSQPSVAQDLGATRLPEVNQSARRDPRLESNPQQQQSNTNPNVVPGNGIPQAQVPRPAPAVGQNDAVHHVHNGGTLNDMRNELKRITVHKLNQVLPTNWREGVPLVNSGAEEAYELLMQQGENPPALLPRNIVHPYEGLQQVDGRLATGHAEVIRFLWAVLVRKPYTGAVLSGSMGSVRIHQILAFSAMCFRVRTRAPRILVVVNRHKEWEDALGLHRLWPQALVLPDSSQRVSSSLSKWQQSGGLLVCSDESYLGAVSHQNSSTRDLARNALCRPGPDIVVLDEASRLSSMSPTVYRMLRRTETTARLAITSVSLAGNLETMWRVLDWTSPRLLGDLEEFRKVFVQRIANGHLRDASSGEEAYRAAAHLFGIVNPVVYPAFGSYGFNRLEKRRLQFDSITLYTNLVGQQIVVYQMAAKFLWQRVNRQELSSYVAAHALQIAATSLAAFKKLLHTGADELIRCPSSGRLKRPIRRVKQIFYDLEQSVSRYLGYGESPKLHIAVDMHRYCMERSEKILMFASSVEVQTALHERLKKYNPPGAKIFNIDLTSSYDARSRLLAQFREWKQGAVLVAPFGPTADCRESAGWGDLVVSRVLILDPSWNAVSEAQCLKRLVSPFSSGGKHRVQVIHLSTAGTIEKLMYTTTMRKYENEVRRLMPSAESATPRHEFEDRAYLALPEIPEEWISDREYPHKGNAEQPPTVDNDRVTKAIVHRDDGLLRQLLKVRLQPRQNAVREISCRRNRCVAVANVADICTRVPLNNADRDIARDEAERISKEHLMQSKATRTGLEAMNRDGTENVGDEIRPEDRNERKSHPVPGHESSVCTLAACWEPYYDLYDKKRETALDEKEQQDRLGNATANGYNNQEDVQMQDVNGSRSRAHGRTNQGLPSQTYDRYADRFPRDDRDERNSHTSHRAQGRGRHSFHDNRTNGAYRGGNGEYDNPRRHSYDGRGREGRDAFENDSRRDPYDDRGRDNHMRHDGHDGEARRRNSFDGGGRGRGRGGRGRGNRGRGRGHGRGRGGYNSYGNQNSGGGGYQRRSSDGSFRERGRGRGAPVPAWKQSEHR